jgi:hypothetical protein
MGQIGKPHLLLSRRKLIHAQMIFFDR